MGQQLKKEDNGSPRKGSSSFLHLEVNPLQASGPTMAPSLSSSRGGSPSTQYRSWWMLLCFSFVCSNVEDSLKNRFPALPRRGSRPKAQLTSPRPPKWSPVDAIFFFGKTIDENKGFAEFGCARGARARPLPRIPPLPLAPAPRPPRNSAES